MKKNNLNRRIEILSEMLEDLFQDDINCISLTFVSDNDKGSTSAIYMNGKSINLSTNMMDGLVGYIRDNPEKGWTVESALIATLGNLYNKTPSEMTEFLTGGNDEC